MTDPWTCKQCDGEMVKTSAEWLCCCRCDAKSEPAPKVEDLPLARREIAARLQCDRLFRIEGHAGLWRTLPRRTYKSILDRRPGVDCIFAKFRHVNGSLHPKEFKQTYGDLREIPFDEVPA